MKNILIILMLLIGMKVSIGQVQIYCNDYSIVDKNVEFNSKILEVSQLKTVSLSNDIPANATLITNCVTSFTSTNYGASAEGCGFFHDNVDCNNSTSPFGGGADVAYTVEDDIWYKFCPANTGVWTMTVNSSSCTPSTNGFQISMFTGTSTNLVTFLSSGPSPGYSGVTVTMTLSTITCIYIQLDGYSGCKCNFSMKISNQTCSLPIELLYFDGVQKLCKQNTLSWATATETNNDHFEIERSLDAINFKKIKEILGAINSLETKQYSFIDSNPELGINYYRLKQVDLDGSYKYAPIIDVDNSCILNLKIIKLTNLLGQEVNEEYGGPKIIYYNDGSILKSL